MIHQEKGPASAATDPGRVLPSLAKEKAMNLQTDNTTPPGLPAFPPVALGVGITLRESDLDSLTTDDLNALARVFDRALGDLLDVAPGHPASDALGGFLANMSALTDKIAGRLQP
jgi:hypothetical protein